MVKIERRKFKNGIVGLAEPLEGKKKVAFYVGIDVGSKNETTEKRGCAHLLEHMLFMSNEFRTSEQIAQETEFNGMEVNALISHSDTMLQFLLTPDRLGLAIEIAYQAIINRAYNHEEFETEKNGPVTTELVSHERDPIERYVRRVLYPRIFKGTPLEEAVIGTFDSVRNLEISDLLKMKQEFYISNNIVVAAAGAVKPEKFFEEIRKTFGKLDIKRKVRHPDLSWRLSPGIKYVEFEDLKDPHKNSQDQAAVYAIYQVNSKQHQDAAGLLLTKVMIGEGFTSYLYKELREKRGIGYSPEASYSSVRGNGVFLMGLPAVHPNKLEETVDVMNEIVQNIKSGKIEKAFFEGKKTQFKSLILSSLEENSYHAYLAITREFEKSFYTPETLIKSIDKMSLDQLHVIAKRNFKGKPLIVVASSPGYKNRFASSSQN